MICYSRASKRLQLTLVHDHTILLSSSLVRDPALFVHNFGSSASVVPFLCTVNVTMAAPGHRQSSSVSQNHKAQLASAYNELGKELSSQKIRVVGNYTMGKVIGEGARSVRPLHLRARLLILVASDTQGLTARCACAPTA